MSWLYLGLAIGFEVLATLSLRMAAVGRKIWLVPVAGGYLISFVLLAMTLRTGVPLGVAYGLWAALGVALIAIFSRAIFKEPITRLSALGLVCIIGGVLLVQIGG